MEPRGRESFLYIIELGNSPCACVRTTIIEREEGGKGRGRGRRLKEKR